MSAARLVLGALGALLAAYGGWLVLAEVGTDRAAAASLAAWLVVGVLVHDLVVAPAASVLGWAGARVLPGRWRGPLAGGLVVLGPLTLAALPLLLGRGGDPANDSLLARDYGERWWVVAAAVALGVVAARVVAAHREHREHGGHGEHGEHGGPRRVETRSNRCSG